MSDRCVGHIRQDGTKVILCDGRRWTVDPRFKNIIPAIREMNTTIKVVEWVAREMNKTIKVVEWVGERDEYNYHSSWVGGGER